MTLRLHDTATRAVRDFVPLREGKASIYLCGLTVQGPPHIGHLRSSVAFDILRRWLIHRGYDVTFIRNLTDIDDKIIRKAAEHGVPWWQWAAVNERAVSAAYDVLGCLPASYEPRATAHVPEMITLMQRLIDAGHAYANGADVFFDVRSLPDYGALSGLKLDEVQQGEDVVAEDRKRDPRDFAMWKAAKEGEPSWPTPWGEGRPGWHLECSAMAGKYLGSAFDIHGGGRDLVFPHHENERAQSLAAGESFAQYWLHNGWVTMSGEKMSKSLGNSLLVSEVVKQYRPVELRYYLGAAHYRSDMEFSSTSLDEAATTFRGIERFLARVERHGDFGWYGVPPEGFAAAMDDDLNVSGALAAVHDAVRAGNVALDNDDVARARDRYAEVKAGLGVLGLDPATFDSGAGDALTGTVDALVRLVLDQRTQARARKDYAAADAIRDSLKAAGVQIEDTPQGPQWSVDTGKA